MSIEAGDNALLFLPTLLQQLHQQKATKEAVFHALYPRKFAKKEFWKACYKQWYANRHARTGILSELEKVAEAKLIKEDPHEIKWEPCERV